MHARQVGQYVTLALLWGSSFLLIGHVSVAFGWVGGVAIRAFIASFLLVVIALLTGRRLRFRHRRHLAAVGLTTVSAQLLGLTYAVPVIGAAMSAVLVATIPLFSMLIGHLWGIERITPTGRWGLALGLLGTVALVGFPAVAFTASFLGGCLAALGGAFAAALGSNWAKRHLGLLDSWSQTVGVFLFGGLGALPFLLLVPVPGGLGGPSGRDWLTLITLAAMCSSLTYVLYFRLIAEVGPTIAISVEFVITVVAVLLGSVVLGERLTPVQFVGGATVLVGCTLVLGLLPPRGGRHRPSR